MALVYLTFVLYEPLHDARLRGVPGIQAVVSAELILWALVAASYSALAPSGRAPALLLVALSLAAAGLAVFCFSSISEESRLRPPRTRGCCRVIPLSFERPRPPMISASGTLPDRAYFEPVRCYSCSSTARVAFLDAEDDLTGKPGVFHFVRCLECGLAYQHPRIDLEHIKAYYDDDYIAHRKREDFGLLTPVYRYIMGALDRKKEKMVRPYLKPGTNEILDVGCGAGTFLRKMRDRHGARVSGVDFKDFSGAEGFEEIDFHCGVFYEQELGERRFDLVTMWHFLEHDYDPRLTLRTARSVMKDDAHLIIEVPRLDSLTFRLYRERWPGLQAPQHTALYDKESFLRLLERAGFESLAYKPYGAFPAYFYVFAGAAFKLLQGRGLNLKKWGYLYVLGQILLAPVLLFERHLNLAMQTAICRKR
jgi:SAM-dependent methyltransferase